MKGQKNKECLNLKRDTGRGRDFEIFQTKQEAFQILVVEIFKDEWGCNYMG